MTKKQKQNIGSHFIKALCFLLLFYHTAFESAAQGGFRGKEETIEFGWECPIIQHEIIGNIQKDGIDMDKQRVTIGVAEEVKLWTDAKYGVTTWQIVGGTGDIFTISDNVARFEASLESGEVTIKAITAEKCEKNITFKVIEPILSYFYKCGLHLQNTNSAGMLLDTRLMPDNVSFHNLVTRESNVTGVGTGALKGLSGKLWHIPGSPTPLFSDWVGPLTPPAATIFIVDTGKGSKTGATDNVYMKVKNEPFIPGTMGTYSFNIPSSFTKFSNQTNSIKILLPSIMSQVHTLNAPEFKAEKGGNSFFADYSSPNTPTQFGDTDCK